MKVIFCSNELIYTGAPLILLDIVKGVKERGVVEPTVYCTSDGPIRNRLEAIGVPVVNYLDWKFDALYLNTVINYRLLLKAKAKGIPSYWAIHESDPNLYLDNASVIEMLKCLRLPRKVIFQAHSTANLYGRFAPGHNFEIIHGAVSVIPGPSREEARAKLGLTNELVCLTIGTIEKRKGQEDIAPCLQNCVRPLRWFVIGRQAHDIPLDPRMTVLGLMDPEDLAIYYKAADIYVCTSRVESYPRTILEALAYGLPVVTTPVYGIKEQVKGNFYRPGDTDELWEVIDKCQSSEAVPHWSLGEMLDRYCTLFAG